MRDLLYSEIAAFHRISNIPDVPELAVAAGTRLCEELLEPLQATFGRLAVRSAFRSSEVNGFGNKHGLNCTRPGMDNHAGSHAEWYEDFPIAEGDG